ncbi:pilus assembly protein N-terminal domain-containing protein (plasmid) [Photobacterium sp. GJ3]|uniref:type II and III secretion system protein family protein n=1 Tax=Photobacterium sp. GJ3 TaxID=2829502 RepID=UPI001B8D3CF8|nr:pilus assembly protein N-terminal domain-containing protein [Photobacterium sp. GJ3]QUJ69731.1 pilus assembly protein N-terminal domain-containing protein [Photobacterium sp. GJ3]
MRVFFLMLFVVLAAQAQAAQSIVLTPDQSRLLRFDQPVKDVFIANGEVAKLHSPSEQHLLVYGMAVGKTDLVITGHQGRTLGHYEVRVVADLTPLEQSAKRAFPETPLTFESTANAIIVSGDVASAQQAHDILSMASGFARGLFSDDEMQNQQNRERSTNERPEDAVPGGGGAQYPHVVNRLRLAGSEQINISVRIIEMERSTSEQLGVRWSAIGKYLQLGVSPGNLYPTPADNSILDKDTVQIDAIIDALVQNNLVTVLAEPNLTAKSGEAATFMSGGEFPFPVGNGDDGPEIEFKNFGISLGLTPTLLSNKRISLTVSPEVSTLSRENSVSIGGVVVPGIETRRTTTTVELADGQSFALAGLVRSYRNQNVEALPFLGEIPILAPFFSSTSYEEGESELVIIATARLVEPTSNPLELATPLDYFRPPSRFERLFFSDFGELSPPDNTQQTTLFGQYGYSY